VDTVGNVSAPAAVTVTVKNLPDAPTLSLSASPTLIAAGGTTTLTWSSSTATSCTASSAWSGSKAPSGSEARTLSSSGTFTLTCSNAGGSATQSASVTVDGQAPSVSLTSPANGATVAGPLSLTATASDDHGLARVDFSLDGTLLASDPTAPYTASWTTTATTEGPHTVQARAVDTVGNVSAPAAVTVTVKNLPDAQPTPQDLAPQVQILSPADGSRFTKQLVKVRATATDDIRLTRLEVYVDGVQKASTSKSSTWFFLYTSQLQSGSHTITAKAYDTAGNIATKSITVTVVK
jgi:hypothetical protein